MHNAHAFYPDEEGLGAIVEVVAAGHDLRAPAAVAAAYMVHSNAVDHHALAPKLGMRCQ